MRSSADRMISRGCLLITSMIGVRSIFCVSSSCRNTGVSRMPRRIQRPMPIRMMLRKNGTRQPQVAKSAPVQALTAKDHQIGQEQARGHAELRPRGDQSAAAVAARPLHRHQHRAAPFAADADALQHAQHGQDDRAPDADRGVGRNEGDEEGGDAHQHQCGDQRRLAADAVAVMPEDRGADRPADEADEVGAERRQRSGQRIFVGEEELREDQPGGGAVDEEVVPLDRRADGGGDHRLAQFRAVLGIRKCAVRGVTAMVAPSRAAALIHCED